MLVEKVNNYSIFIVDDFMSDGDCDTLVNWFIGAPKSRDVVSDFYKDRTISFSQMFHQDIKIIVNSYRFDVSWLARTLFKEKLYIDYTDAVHWPSGMEMKPHSDNCWLDGSPNYTNWRTHTAVLYLNDDYEGGRTFFPEINYESTPKKGRVIIFPSGIEYLHGVTKVEGDRYTLSTWFTPDRNYIER